MQLSEKIKNIQSSDAYKSIYESEFNRLLEIALEESLKESEYNKYLEENPETTKEEFYSMYVVVDISVIIKNLMDIEIDDYLSDKDEVDINQLLAIWALQQVRKNADVDKDILNKASECVVACSNFFKAKNNGHAQMLLKNTLFEWAKKEPTNIDFKAKFR